MSNRLYIDAAKVQKKDEESYSDIIVFDDYETIHIWFDGVNDSLGLLSDDTDIFDVNDVTLLIFAYHVDDAKEMIDFSIEVEKGITINNTYYDNDEVKEMLKGYDDKKRET